jgi:hypothetical protein
VTARLPDFVCVGALKAGTTYLEALLRDHPDLCLPSTVKEVDYFSLHHERGEQWYRDQFDGCAVRMHGEVSPRYLVDADSPARIAAANADVRLLLLVRDPVTRVSSQYKHRVRTTSYRASFEDYLAENPGALERGRYGHHAGRYLERFDRAQLHVVVFEDLVRDPVAAMRSAYGFLGVDASHALSQHDRPLNEAWQPSRRRAYVLAKRLSGRLHDLGYGSVASRAARSPLAGWVTGRHEQLDVSAPSEATTSRLRQHYTADVEALSALVGRDLAELWWARQPEPVA